MWLIGFVILLILLLVFYRRGEWMVTKNETIVLERFGGISGARTKIILSNDRYEYYRNGDYVANGRSDDTRGLIQRVIDSKCSELPDNTTTCNDCMWHRITLYGKVVNLNGDNPCIALIEPTINKIVNAHGYLQ